MKNVDIQAFVELLPGSSREVCEGLLDIFFGRKGFDVDRNIADWQAIAIQWQLLALISLYRTPKNKDAIDRLIGICRSQERRGIIPPFGIIKAILEMLVKLHYDKDRV